MLEAIGLTKDFGTHRALDTLDLRVDPVGTKRKLLYVPEQIALFDELTGVENLAYFAALSGIEE